MHHAAAAESGFSPTGSMTKVRDFHTATLLPSGKVLAAAGFGAADIHNRAQNSAELYDPAAGTWSATGSLAASRGNHTATLLPSGMVLVAGGMDPNLIPLASAELYNPATGTWSTTGSLAVPRSNHTATLLSNGKVLVAGGSDLHGNLTTAELYDPATGIWTTTGSLSTARDLHTATLLPNGKVLVAGGSISSSSSTPSQSLASAELYDPTTGTWTNTGTLSSARTRHAATLLPNGEVLVAGGASTSDYLASVASAELYDPASGSWSLTGSLSTARTGHTETLLPSGKVLVTGGINATGYLASAELYDPATGSWSPTGGLSTKRLGHTATLLPSGQTLVAGGLNSNETLASAELYSHAQLQNISTRLNVLGGDQVLIGGFITGNAPKKVMVRAIGPSLMAFGVPGALADPTLELHFPDGSVVTNDNWKVDDKTGQSQEAAIRATTIPPSNDLESAIVQTLAPGAYTAIVRGNHGGTGIGLIEVYDLEQSAPSELANVSTRGFVDTGDNVMIGGFILGPGGSSIGTVLVRGLGPSLPVSPMLADPTLELHNGNGAKIASNDNWKIDDQTGQSQEAAVRATTLAPTNDLESALVANLAPGNYTVIIAGKNGGVGIGLIEAYNLR